MKVSPWIRSIPNLSNPNGHSPFLLSIIGIGAAAAIFFSAIGSALSSAQGGMFATKSSSAGIWCYAPIVINGVLAIYGLIIAIIIQSQMNDSLDLENGYRLLCSGIVVGLGCLASGIGKKLMYDNYSQNVNLKGKKSRSACLICHSSHTYSLICNRNEPFPCNVHGQPQHFYQ